MALIECRECQQQVSDQAHACPHCGVPIKPAKQEQTQSEPVSQVQEVVIRDRTSYEFEKLGTMFVSNLPVWTAIFAIFYGFFRLKVANNWVEVTEAPEWMKVASFLLVIALVIFRKKVNLWPGWVASAIFIIWFIFSPDTVVPETPKQIEAREQRNMISKYTPLSSAASSFRTCHVLITERRRLNKVLTASEQQHCQSVEQTFKQMFAAGELDVIEYFCRVKGEVSKVNNAKPLRSEVPLIDQLCIAKGH